jgi:uncharacterized membrane protein YjfL (UPF0719 family)
MKVLGLFNISPVELGGALLSMVIFALVAIVLMVIGYKVFDLIMTKVDVQKELAERQNIAVAIVIGAVILGVAIIVAASMS